MTSIASIRTISRSAYRDYWPISRKAYWMAWNIIFSFSINITAYLSPCAIIILINPYMSTFISIVAIITSADSDYRPISRKAYWMPWLIISSFSINITAYLSPSAVIILINPYMSTIKSIPIISSRTNSNNRTVRRKIQRPTWIISFMFSINITAYLSPSAVIILINPYMAA